MVSSLMERLNDRRDGAEDAGEDAGFTLIELMVVLLIMAILLAIAIPTFLGVTGSANDRAAQSNLNTAYTSAKNYYESNGQSFGTSTSTALATKVQTDEPGLGVQTAAGATVTANQIAFQPSTTGNGLAMYSLAKKTNVCWFIVDNTTTIATTLAPWTTTAGTGVPESPGVYYGYVTGTCDPAGIAGSTHVQSGGFPAAP